MGAGQSESWAHLDMLILCCYQDLNNTIDLFRKKNAPVSDCYILLFQTLMLSLYCSPA